MWHSLFESNNCKQPWSFHSSSVTWHISIKTSRWSPAHRPRVILRNTLCASAFPIWEKKRRTSTRCLSLSPRLHPANHFWRRFEVAFDSPTFCNYSWFLMVIISFWPHLAFDFPFLFAGQKNLSFKTKINLLLIENIPLLSHESFSIWFKSIVFTLKGTFLFKSISSKLAVCKAFLGLLWEMSGDVQWIMGNLIKMSKGPEKWLISIGLILYLNEIFTKVLQHFRLNGFHWSIWSSVKLIS